MDARSSGNTFLIKNPSLVDPPTLHSPRTRRRADKNEKAPSTIESTDRSTAYRTRPLDPALNASTDEFLSRQQMSALFQGHLSSSRIEAALERLISLGAIYRPRGNGQRRINAGADLVCLVCLIRTFLQGEDQFQVCHHQCIQGGLPGRNRPHLSQSRHIPSILRQFECGGKSYADFPDLRRTGVSVRCRPDLSRLETRERLSRCPRLMDSSPS